MRLEIDQKKAYFCTLSPKGITGKKDGSVISPLEASNRLFNLFCNSISPSKS